MLRMHSLSTKNFKKSQLILLLRFLLLLPQLLLALRNLIESFYIQIIRATEADNTMPGYIADIVIKSCDPRLRLQLESCVYTLFLCSCALTQK